MYTRSVFRPSSTPFLPLFLPLSGDHTIHSFGGDRLPFKISGNTHRALDTTTSTRRRGHHSMASSIMGSPLLSLFVVKVATRFRASASSSSSRDGRWTGGAIDSDRALSLCIFSLFHSRSLVTTSCRCGLFEKMHTKRLKNESAKKRTLATVRFLNWPETAENCVSWVV